MEALKGATLEELIDSGVRPAHARLILSNLDSSLANLELATTSVDDSSAEVSSFLKSVGLQNCGDKILEGGYNTLDELGKASIQDLIGIGLQPVHARLIVSNLDIASR